jgi:hypothetical protein
LKPNPDKPELSIENALKKISCKAFIDTAPGKSGYYGAAIKAKSFDKNA